ncbi:excinuclease ABC subunit A [Herbaspirillum sp. HC18]|nr:excinuclease ABC subunit A [Herbaspirillum sp. HC18]
MKKLLLTALAAAAMQPALARDDHRMYPIKDALETPEAQSRLDKHIKLFFGDQPYPKSAKVIGEWRTNKKTNGFNKSDKHACEWVFLSAVMELQERAQKEGGDAVVGIKSNYKNEERSSENEYMCGSGALMSGVALKGTVVKLSK